MTHQLASIVFRRFLAGSWQTQAILGGENYLLCSLMSRTPPHPPLAPVSLRIALAMYSALTVVQVTVAAIVRAL